MPVAIKRNVCSHAGVLLGKISLPSALLLLLGVSLNVPDCFQTSSNGTVFADRQSYLHQPISPWTTRQTDLAENRVQPMRPDPGCPRILEMRREGRAGLGHQVTEILIALRLGTRLGLTPKISPFDKIESSHGEDYTSMNDLIGLRHISNVQYLDKQIDRAKLRVTEFKDIVPGECNILVRADTDSCKHINCFHSPTTSLLFQDMAFILRRNAREHGNWLRRNPFTHASTFTVIWHVRVGDIQLHEPGDSFYSNVYAGLQDVLQDFKDVKHILVGAWHRLSQELLSTYEAFFNNTLPTASMVNLATDEAVLYMMHSDLLIGSGSSLPLVAVLFSDKTVYVNSESLKPGHQGWGFLGDYFQEGLTADSSGKIYQHASEVRALFSRKDVTFKLKPEAVRKYYHRHDNL